MTINTNGDWEGWSVSYADGWKIPGGRERCSGGPGSADYDVADNVVRVSIPRGCLEPQSKRQPPRTGQRENLPGNWWAMPAVKVSAISRMCCSIWLYSRTPA
jgi:hypothetical protein